MTKIQKYMKALEASVFYPGWELGKSRRTRREQTPSNVAKRDVLKRELEAAREDVVSSSHPVSTVYGDETRIVHKLDIYRREHAN